MSEHAILSAIRKLENGLYRVEGKLDAVLAAQDNIKMLLDDLEASLTKETDAETAIVTLLTTVSAELKAAGTDPKRLKALQDKIDTNTSTLAAAVVANTPAATPPTP